MIITSALSAVKHPLLEGVDKPSPASLTRVGTIVAPPRDGGLLNRPIERLRPALNGHIDVAARHAVRLRSSLDPARQVLHLVDRQTHKLGY